MTIDTDKLAKLITLIEKTAAFKAHSDGNEDFNPHDYSGGNIDDAYQLGYDDGEIKFARRLMSILN